MKRLDKILSTGRTAIWQRPAQKRGGQTIVMIHGFRGTHHGLLGVAKHISGEYALVIPDLPGFGESEPLKNHSLEQYVEWLNECIASLGLSKPPILLGHSFGSIITSAYAAKYPATIQKLILVNPIGAPALEGPKAVMSRLALAYYQAGKYLPGKVAHAWLSAQPIVMIMSITMAKTKDKQLRRFIHAQHKQYFSLFSTPSSVLEAFSTSIRHNVGQVASELTMPTLLIAGEKDDITPVARQQAITTRMPHAKLHVIDNVGHLTHYETPQTVAKLVTEFLASS